MFIAGDLNEFIQEPAEEIEAYPIVRVLEVLDVHVERKDRLASSRCADPLSHVAEYRNADNAFQLHCRVFGADRA